jgi:hypothetical protein
MESTLGDLLVFLFIEDRRGHQHGLEFFHIQRVQVLELRLITDASIGIAVLI